MRRSSSRQRGSRLPERSTAPPSDQNLFQDSRVSRRDLLVRGQHARRHAGGEADEQVERVALGLGRQQVVVLGAPLEAALDRPGEAHPVAVVVQLALEKRVPRGRADELGLVRLRPRPVRRRLLAAAVGKAQPDPDLSASDERRDDAHSDRVAGGMAEGLDHDLLAVQPEARQQRPVPELETLLDLLHVLRGRLAPVLQSEAEADPPEVQPVRVAPQPLDLGRALVARHVGVGDLAAVRLERREAEAVDRVAVRVGVRVPRPLRQRAERDAFVVRLGEGLETGCVDGEGELAVADRERRAGVEAAQHGRVAAHERAAVDRLLRGRSYAEARGDDDRQGERPAEAESHPRRVSRVV